MVKPNTIGELKFNEVSDDLRNLNKTRPSKYDPILKLLFDMKTVKLETVTDDILNNLRVTIRNRDNRFRLRSIRQPEFFIVWLEGK